MIIKVINNSPHPLPAYETNGASGVDIRAWLNEPISLNSLERKLISTGLYIELPEGYEAQIRPRSGLAAKKGLSILNAPGTIDSDYRGEIKIILVNLSDCLQRIDDGERIAQMVISRYERVAWERAIELNVTDRGSGGFGHTGMN
ncbi:MAG: dUTP diphosphatase [Chitinophagales bacterium]|jgi:dUTP pyrophosphatase|nr:dUTP diphosphatase [Chitinophagales bacterium]